MASDFPFLPNERLFYLSELDKTDLIFIFPAHVDNEMCLVRALERLGSAALSKEEPDIGAAFLKFSVVTKELSALMKTLVRITFNQHFIP